MDNMLGIQTHLRKRFIFLFDKKIVTQTHQRDINVKIYIYKYNFREETLQRSHQEERLRHKTLNGSIFGCFVTIERLQDRRQMLL